MGAERRLSELPPASPQHVVTTRPVRDSGSTDDHAHDRPSRDSATITFSSSPPTVRSHVLAHDALPPPS